MLKALIAMTFAVIVSAPGIADRIRHPGTTQVAGHCQTTCQYNPLTRQNVCNTFCF